MPKLTPIQRRWIHAYLYDCNMDAKAAAMAIGISEEDARREGSRMLRLKPVRDAVQQALEEVTMSPAEITARLSIIARSSFDDFYDIEETGAASLNLAKARERGVLQALQSLKPTKEGLELRRYSPLDAMEQLARIHKMFGDSAVQIDVRVLTVIMDALPADFRRSVVDALAQQVDIVGQLPPARDGEEADTLEATLDE